MLPYITKCYIDSRFFLPLEQSRLGPLGCRLEGSPLREAARWQLSLIRDTVGLLSDVRNKCKVYYSNFIQSAKHIFLIGICMTISLALHWTDVMGRNGNLTRPVRSVLKTSNAPGTSQWGWWSFELISALNSTQLVFKLRYFCCKAT